MFVVVQSVFFFSKSDTVVVVVVRRLVCYVQSVSFFQWKSGTSSSSSFCVCHALLLDDAGS